LGNRVGLWDPDKKILDAVVVNDAVRRVAHDIEIDLVGRAAVRRQRRGTDAFRSVPNDLMLSAADVGTT
jgi:hypothetical protein